MPRRMSSKALHQAFAKDYFTDKQPEAEKRFEEFKKQYPEIADYHKLTDFYPADYQHLMNDDDAALCAFLVNTNGKGAPLWDAEILMERAEGKADKNVVQGVEEMVQHYKHMQNVLESEGDETYKALHADIVKAYENYFAVAVEDLLSEAYGDDYDGFAEKWRADEQKRRNAAKAKRDAKKKAAEKTE